MTFTMASWTFFLVVVDLMFDAVPYSLLSMATASLIWRPGGTYRETSSVPLPSLEPSLSKSRFSRKRCKDVRFLSNYLSLLIVEAINVA